MFIAETGVRVDANEPDVASFQRELAANLEALNDRLAQLRAWTATLTEEGERERADSVEDLSAYARSGRAPEVLRGIQEKVDRGEASWYAVMTGEADGAFGADTATFLDERLSRVAALSEALRDGSSPDEAVARVHGQKTMGRLPDDHES